MLTQPGRAISFKFQNAVSANVPGNVLNAETDSSGAFAYLVVQITGITTATVNFEVSNDNTNWVALEMESVGASATKATSATANGMWRGLILGCKYVRMRISGWSVGAVTVTGIATA